MTFGVSDTFVIECCVVCCGVISGRKKDPNKKKGRDVACYVLYSIHMALQTRKEKTLSKSLFRTHAHPSTTTLLLSSLFFFFVFFCPSPKAVVTGFKRDVSAEITGFLEVDWAEFIGKQKTVRCRGSHMM